MGRHRSIRVTCISRQPKRQKRAIGHVQVVSVRNNAYHPDGHSPSNVIPQTNSTHSHELHTSPTRQLTTNHEKESSYSLHDIKSSWKDNEKKKKKYADSRRIRCSPALLSCLSLITALLLIGIVMAIYIPIVLNVTTKTTRAISTSMIITTNATITTGAPTNATTISITNATTMSITNATAINSTNVTTTTTQTASITTPSFVVCWNSTGTTIAGITSSPGLTTYQLYYPAGLIVDSPNTIYVADSTSSSVKRWVAGAVNSTIVAGQSNGISGTALNKLHTPFDVALDSSNNLYVADTLNNRVVFWPNGASSGLLFAGNGTAGSANNQLHYPYGISLDWSTNVLYIADWDNHRIMQYFSNSSVGTAVAGGNGPGYNNTQLNFPRRVYFDSSSNSMYIVSDIANNVVRWILGATSWTIVAGSISGLSSSSSTLLNAPTDVMLDSIGNVYVADKGNHRVQFFLAGQSNGTTIAGVTSTPGTAPNLLDGPDSIYVDSQFNLYVSDMYNDRIQQFLHC